MKTFIRKTIFLGLPILVFLIVLEIVLRQIPNDYKKKAAYLDLNSNKIETLILGSSHSFYGLNPEYFTSHTYNASHVSQSLDIDLKVLKKYEDKVSSLKTIYLPVSYYTLWFTLSESNEAWRTQSYIDSYKLTDGHSYADCLKITGNFKQNILKTKSFLFENKSFINVSDKGWGTRYSSKNAQDLETTGIGAAERHTKDLESDLNKNIFSKNINSLHQIINWCDSNNIKLVIFTAPAYKSYRNLLNPLQLDTTISTLNKMVSISKTASYINLLEDLNFTKEDFYDADHLSDIGAKKLSKRIELLAY